MFFNNKVLNTLHFYGAKYGAKIALAIIYLLVFALFLGLYKWQRTSPLLITPDVVVSDWSEHPKSCYENSFNINVSDKYCELSAHGNVILFGDSHAQQLVFGFERLTKEFHNWSSKKLIFVTSLLMRGNWRSPDFVNDPQVKYIQDILSKTTKKDLVVFSITSRHVEDSVFASLMKKGELQKDFSNLMASIFYNQPVKGRIILMLDTPRLENNVARICSYESGRKNKLCLLEKEDYERQNSYLNQAFVNFISMKTSNAPGAKILNPKSIFCSKSKCQLFDDDGFMLIDGNHIKMSVSKRLVEELFLEYF